ncbi:MAG: hypothetical protein NC253_12920 [Ruminococcus sp.]|nr:hypothetical protein [Ruminococcus sp.]MCM1381667.1 hypothetical protein [Muribaculaceae bacterium]MCM1479898.1 hypothetical protein [Muribaculaceae bacterium]
MNMISTATAPYLLYSEKSGKPKQTYGNRFSDALEQEQAENEITVSAAEIAVNEMNRERTESTEPTYTVTEEAAAYFREKYGEEYNEEKPCQLFYELAEKKIISTEDASNASGFSRIFSAYNWQQGGAWKESFTNHNINGGFNSYYERFMNEYDKEITAWLDVAQREYDFNQYLINLDEELLAPDGSHYRTGKEQMNAGFRKDCESILKVKDVLTQIFGE